MALRVAKPKIPWTITESYADGRPKTLRLSDAPECILRIESAAYAAGVHIPDDLNAIKAMNYEQAESYLKFLFDVLGNARNDSCTSERVIENLSDVVFKVRSQYIHHGGDLPEIK